MSFLTILDFFNYPIQEMLEYLGIANKPISIGFGSIEWFNLTISQVISIIISIMIYYFIVKLIYKSFKKLLSYVGGLFR